MSYTVPDALSLAVFLMLLLCPAIHARERAAIVLENEYLRVEIDPTTGGFLSVLNKAAQLELVTDATAARQRAPWVLLLGENDRQESTYRSFAATRHGNTACDLTWITNQDSEVCVHAQLPPGQPSLLLWPRVTNQAGMEIAGLVYPLIDGIGALTEGGKGDRLAHPFATGFLFRNPNLLFGLAPHGIPKAIYPSGEGASMQFMTYYAEGQGGFYLATHDPYETAKELNFARADSGRGLACSFVHRNWDMRPATDFAPDYPVVIGSLRQGRWEEAADRYRDWALQQPWVRGPLAQRTEAAKSGQGAPDVAPWLVENVGLTTFGSKGAVANPDLYRQVRSIVQAPVLHVYYGQPIPDGTGLLAVNRKQVRNQGDYLASFENDIIVPVYASDYDAAAAVQPRHDAAWGNWRATWMDPTLPYIRERQAARARSLLRSAGVDAFYYDISTSFGPLRCFEIAHGHPKGYGRWIIDGYREFHRAVRDAAASVQGYEGRYIPMGTEGIHELALPVIDFYQARANAFPACHPFEGSQFNGYLQGGAAERIPLFEYVYHEVGPVRMDGWGQLSDAEGDYAYAIAARTVLWGGIYQLNYEFAGLPGDPSPWKVALIRDLAAARTTFGQAYLAYGRMMPAPRLDAPPVWLGYKVANLPGGARPVQGAQVAPGVINSAWLSPQGDLAFFFVNLHTSPITISFHFSPVEYGWAGDTRYTQQWVDCAGAPIAPEAALAEGAVVITRMLPPRRVVMLELRAL